MSVISELRRLRRLVATMISVGLYFAVSPVGYACFAVALCIRPSDKARRARRLQGIITNGFRFMHDWLRLAGVVEFNHRKAMEPLPARPCIVVANHPTLMDVSAITAAIGGSSTVVKPALFQRFWIRPLMQGAGLIEGPGENRMATGRVVDEAISRLRDGLNLLIFPEGTRSPKFSLRQFGRTAFEIACRADVPIISIGVKCEPSWLSKNDSLLRPPSLLPQLTLETLAIDLPSASNFDSRTLRRRVERRYHNWYAGNLPCTLEPNPDAEPKDLRWKNHSKNASKS